MSSEIDLMKKIYDKTSYTRIIDTSFTQLTSSNSTITVDLSSSVVEFFGEYNNLFYIIPKTGSVNSHEYLIKQSTEYVGMEYNDERIQALTEEIANLREVNLSLNQQILDITNNFTSSL
jgi:hypothetical protein